MKKIIYLIIILLTTLSIEAQTQKGQTLSGNVNDYLGYSVTMSDKNTVAVGSPGDNSTFGAVKVYSWNGSSWIQKGTTINGQNANDGFGNTVNMPDDNTIIIGMTGLNSSTGAVIVYHWNGSAWQQKGQIVYGDSTNDCFGCSINMPDSNTFIVGEPGIMPIDGHVKVFRWNDTNWVQKGMTFTGTTNNDRFGMSVYMPDSNTLAFGAPGATAGAGNVYVYKWNGGNWVQRGVKLFGTSLDDLFGSAVAMPDSNTLIAGAAQTNSDPGYVKVFRYNGSNWAQKGQKINGIYSLGKFGMFVAMPDSNIFLVSSLWADSNKGYIQIYSWNNSNWVQKGLTIYGSANNEYFGSSLSMPDSNTFAIGGCGANSNAGIVKVYSFITSGIAKLTNANDISVFPNPFSEAAFLHSGRNLRNATLRVYDLLGQKVAQIKNISGNSVVLHRGSLPAGVYLLRLSEKGTTIATQKIMVSN